ncbi:glutamine synthetase family protein [Alicyclobacillus sp. ALC3]|uniref:glutamine synthetase family protein n=1 Tax=Alicyclobacillus sp. ALC3 TaxID=2796143 RepID=UPI002378A88C|nr:glutamine synthetase family protein [Alicyclobacillus sp. ALC3]WDL97284.1 glutamine synthetase [Alicyclobacillus sp. ALC3]
MNEAARQVIELAQASQVRFVRLQFVDLHGALKSVEIPRHQLGAAFQTGVFFDGSSVAGFVRSEESDMILQPDASTWRVIPLEVDPRSVGQLTCDVCLPDGFSFSGDSRSVLRKVLLRSAELGFTDVQLRLEVEFYLFRQDKDRHPRLEPSDNDGYFDMSASLEDTCLRQIAESLTAMNVPVAAIHHEVGPGQYEVVLDALPALAAADALLTVKMVVKSVSARHHLFATFMPKPLQGFDGSGLHVFQSLLTKDGSAFTDSTHPDGLSLSGLHYIAGLFQHAPGLTALTNPLVNSYKRLVPRLEAPAFICWAVRYRNPFVRVTRHTDARTWIELRSPDVTCNPYLAFAAMISAGLDGVTRSLAPPQAVEAEVSAMSNEERLLRGIFTLPTNLAEALSALEEDVWLEETIGEHLLTRFLNSKSLEWQAYQNTVHAWEHDQYLEL